MSDALKTGLATATLEQFLVAVALLLIISIVASKASGRLGVPALLLFIGIGILAGSEGLVGIEFSDASAAQSVGIIALAFILFAGGLETDWSFVRSSVARAASLATVGVTVTALLVGWFAHATTGLSLVEGMLLGVIVSSTDAAAVFSILRSSGVRLRKEVAATLELESGSNDPMAVFLTTAFIELALEPRTSFLVLAIDLVREMLFGAVAGLLFGRIAVYTVNRIRLAFDGLYPVLTIALVLLTYGATDLIGGSGFLAVYIAAIVMGNRNFIQRRRLTRFHDGIAWLMQIAMFLTLGLLVSPSQLFPVAAMSLLIAAFLIIVARPTAVLASLCAARMDLREKMFVSWVGLRGAVPIILATFPLLAGVPNATLIFNVVFFIVLASVALQGTTIGAFARWLGVDSGKNVEHSPSTVNLANRAESALITVEVTDDSRAHRCRLVEIEEWPREALVLVLYRGDEFFVPNGATEIHAGDRLIVLTSKKSSDQVRALAERKTPDHG